MASGETAGSLALTLWRRRAMKLICPCCSARVPAGDISLDTGWAKCAACSEVFPLRDLLPGYQGARRPFDAKVVVERSAQELSVELPAQGVSVGAVYTLGFALFWLSFIALWTAGALGFGQAPLGGINLAFTAFSIPFWLVGLAMLGQVAWAVCGRRAVHIDAGGMTARDQCLGWSRTRQVEFERVQHARPAAWQANGWPHVNNRGAAWLGVEIVYAKGTIRLPVSGEEEQQWLLFEVNDFLRTLAGPRSASPGG
jgi:hypothetical protein